MRRRRVFVSYARADDAWVAPLVAALRGAGVDVWRDQEDIRPGEAWDTAIAAALAASETVVVVLSPAALASTRVADELEWARAAGTRIVPVIARHPCRLPFGLARYQALDLSRDYAAGLERLVATLLDAP